MIWYNVFPKLQVADVRVQGAILYYIHVGSSVSAPFNTIITKHKLLDKLLLWV